MLSLDQQTALNDINTWLSSTSHLEYVLSGSPGSGKSYLTSEVIEIAGSKDYEIVPCATTNPAVAVLEELCGHEAYTIHTMLDLRVMTDYTNNTTYLIEKDRKTFWNKFYKNKSLFTDRPIITGNKTKLILIDEASYIDKELYRYIQKFIINNKCKILYIGDKNQLPPVNTTVPYIWQLPIPSSTLTTNHRYDSTSQINDVCNELKFEIENESYFIPEITTGTDIEILNGDDFQQTLEDHYLSDAFEVDPYFMKTIAYRNNIVDGINDHIRNVLGYGKNFEIGEKVVFNKPRYLAKKPFGVLANNGDIATIVDIFKTTEESINGYLITFQKLNSDKTFSGFYTKHTRLLARKKKEYVQAKNWSKLEHIDNYFVSIKPLYASTVHKAQGASYDNVFIHLADIIQCRDIELLPRLIYVALSRAKEKIYIYGEVPDRIRRTKK